LQCFRSIVPDWNCIHINPSVAKGARVEYTHNHVGYLQAATQRLHRRVGIAMKRCAVFVQRFPGGVNRGNTQHLVQRQAQHSLGSSVGCNDFAGKVLNHHPAREGLQNRLAKGLCP